MAKKIDKDNVEKWYDYDIDINNRTIYLGSTRNSEDEPSGIDFFVAERTIKALHILESNAPNGDNPITIILNSAGGDVTQALAIYDTILACKNPVTILAKGECCSAATYILQAADERILSPNCVFMIHYGYESHADEHPKVIRNWSKFYEDVQEKLCENILLNKILEKHPDFKGKKLKEMLDFDTIMIPEQVVELGLADKVMEE